MAVLPNDQRSIDRLTEPDVYRSEKVTGLVLEIRQSGSKKWRLKFQVGRGSSRSLKTWTIGDARKIAIGRAEAEARERLAQVEITKRDPRADRRGETFDALVRAWVERHGKQHKRSWQRDLDLHERLIEPRLGSLAAQEINREHVLAALDDIADKIGPIQANRAQALISAAFSWALDEGQIKSHPTYRLRKRGKEKVRDRHLSPDELRRYWQGLDGLPRHIADALRLLTLLGQRRSEVGGMQTGELMLDGEAVWTIPATRVKNKLKHAVPLPPLVLQIIKRQEPKGSYVFPSRLIEPKPIEGSTLSARFADLMSELKIAEVRLHDLRHTVKTGLAQLGVPEGISDRVTNQVSGQRTRIGSRYDHHTYLDEKRRALQLWQDRLLEIVEGRPASGERW